MKNVKYKHTNLIARDWQALAEFYENVFGCKRVAPEKHMLGEWLEKGTGVPDAEISGVHLMFPGHGDAGPTLEIYHYSKNEVKPAPKPNREGLGHLAFEVEDVTEALAQVKLHGGDALGEPASHKSPDGRILTFVYATDPEGNIVELQNRQ